MTKVILPKTNETGANEWADVYSNDSALANVVNGELDNENLASSAGIVDTKLASPNNAIYRTILTADQIHGNEGGGAPAAGTYVIAGATTAYKSGSSVTVCAPSIYIDDADFTVSGKTIKLRIRAQVGTNGTKPATNFTFGLYPVTPGGSPSQLIHTLGTVVSGSTVAINAPNELTLSSAVTSDFAVPTDGYYSLGYVTSASLASNAAAKVSAQLQIRHV